MASGTFYPAWKPTPTLGLECGRTPVKFCRASRPRHPAHLQDVETRATWSERPDEDVKQVGLAACAGAPTGCPDHPLP